MSSPSNTPKSSRSSAFGVDVLTLVTGTTVAQIITILASPIITRIYGPETFGLLALFTSITSILGVIACMRYELAIMLPETDEEAANVFGLCVFFVIIISMMTIIPLFLFQHSLLQFLNASQLGPFLWLIPITILISGIFLALNYWNTRTKHFHRLSTARVMSSCASTGTQLGLGFLGHASGGALIGASILGQIVSTLALGVQIMRDHFSFFKKNITWNGMEKVLIRYSNFPKYDIWSALLSTMSWQIPIFLLSYFFSTTVVGYYSLSMMIIQIPMSFIGSSIAQVFFQRAAEAKVEGTLRPLVKNIFEFLTKIGLFPILMLAFIGKDLFMVVFGQAWGEAGIYVQIISLWAFFWFITSPLSTILIVLGKLELNLKLNIIVLTTRVLSFIIGGIMGSVILAISLFSLSGILTLGFGILLYLKYVEIPFRETIGVLMSNFLIFLPVSIILFISNIILSPVYVVALSLVILLLYYVYLYQTDKQMKDLLIQLKI